MKSCYLTFIWLLFCLVSPVLCSACQTNVAEIKEAKKVSTIVGNQFVPTSGGDIYQIPFRESGSSLAVSDETTCSEAGLALLSQLSHTSKSIVDGIRLLQDNSLGEKIWGLVNISGCNLWRGTSAKGIDCIGFVKTVYSLNGIVLVLDASLQFRREVFTTLPI